MRATGPASTPAATIPVRGQLLEGATRAPVASAQLVLTGPSTVRTACDAEGRFALDLPADLWAYGDPIGLHASLEGATRQFAFSGGALLEREMVLVGRTHLVLHGQLVLGPEFARESEPGLGVRASVPASPAVPVAVFAGDARLDRENRFRIEVWVDRVPPAFALAFGSGRGELCSLEVATGELTCAEGARIELALQRLELVVRDEHGSALPGVELTLLSQAPGAGGQVLYGRTDPEGRAAFALLPGGAELCAAIEGYSSSVVRLAIPPGPAGAGRALERKIVLHALGPDDRIAGLVIDHHGSPVAGAYVSAFPHKGGDAGTGHVGAESDARGRFVLEVACDVPLEVVAHHRELGFSPTQLAAAGELELVLVIEPQGSLALELVGFDAAAASGGFEWLLIGTGAEEVLSSHEWSPRLVLEEIPEGDYELWVRVSGRELLGHGEVGIQAVQETSARVELAPAQVLRGRLAWPGGDPASGLSVAALETSLPVHAAALWSAGETAGDGSFALLLGTSLRSTLLVSDAHGELSSFELAAGDAGTLVVPR